MLVKTLSSLDVSICTTTFSTKTLSSTHTVYLCFIYGSQDKQRFLPHTISRQVSTTEMECLLRGRTECLNVI